MLGALSSESSKSNLVTGEALAITSLEYDRYMGEDVSEWPDMLDTSDMSEKAGLGLVTLEWWRRSRNAPKEFISRQNALQ